MSKKSASVLLRTGLVASAAFLFFMFETAAQQTIPLFNGKDLSGWHFVVDKDEVAAEAVFNVQDGCIHIKGNPFGYMYTKEKYADFKLHVEWKWQGEASNSGIFLLIEEAKNPFPNGIECQLAAGKAGDFVLLGGSDLVEFQHRQGTPRPAFPVVPKANESSEKPVGEWNSANIFVTNGTITVFVNGVYQNTGTNRNKSGHIGLQSEGKDVLFRHVILTRL